MQTTIRKPRVQIDPPGDPIKAPRWRNIFIIKNLPCIPGIRTYDDAHAACLLADVVFKQIHESPNDIWELPESGKQFLGKHLIGHLQMPVKE